MASVVWAVLWLQVAPAADEASLLCTEQHLSSLRPDGELSELSVGTGLTDRKLSLTEKYVFPQNEQRVKATQSCLTLSTSLTIQSMEFSRPEYWRG